MKVALTAVLLCGLSLTVNGAETLTWDQCLDIAARKNPDLRAAERSRAARRASYLGSYNGLFPSLGLSSSYSDSRNPNRSARYQAAGTARLDIFNRETFATIKAASASWTQADANLELVSSTLLFDLKSAFANLYFSQHQIDVAKNIQDIREKNSRLVSLRYASGRESKGNMLRAKAELLEANVDVSQAEREFKAAQHALNRHLGQDDFSAVVATGALPVGISAVEPSNWIDLVSEHPRVLVEESNLTVARTDVDKARSPIWPTVSANYTRSFQGEEYFPVQMNWNFTGVLSLPIFGGGPTATYHSVQSAKRNLEKAEEDLRSTRNQVRTDLESAWAGFMGATEQAQVQEAFLEAARQRNGEADVRYANGLMTYENWEQIVTDRVNFERSLIRAQRDAVVAEADWARSRGIGLGE